MVMKWLATFFFLTNFFNHKGIPMNNDMIRAIKAIREELNNIDSNPREKYDKFEMQKEFQNLYEIAVENGLPFYAALFAAKEANHRGDYEVAIDSSFIAVLMIHREYFKSTDDLKNINKNRIIKRERLLKSVRLNWSYPLIPDAGKSQFKDIRDFLLDLDRNSSCLNNKCICEDTCYKNEMRKDLPIVIGTYIVANFQLNTVNPKQVKELAKLAFSSIFEFEKNEKDWFEQIIKECQNIRSEWAFCTYKGGSRRQIQDLLLTCLRIFGKEYIEKKIMNDELFELKFRNHPWFDVFMGDLYCDIYMDNINMNNPNIDNLNCEIIKEEAIDYYANVITENLKNKSYSDDFTLNKIKDKRIPKIPEYLANGSIIAKRKDRSLIYSIIRLQRLHNSANNRHNVLLNELRFNFDAMYWTKIEKEKQFNNIIGHMTKSSDNISAHEPCPFDYSNKNQTDLKIRVHENKFYRNESSPATISLSNQSENDYYYYPDQFCILRSWSSFTPNLPQIVDPRAQDSAFTSRGGGYLLRWHGYGIAIDPGTGFIRNLYDCGYKIDDIDIVIITHNHFDHSYDLPGILDLDFRSKNKKIINFIFAPNVLTVQKELIFSSGKNKKIYELKTGGEILIKEDNGAGGSLVIHALPAHHQDLGDEENSSIGLDFKIIDNRGDLSKRIVISSDTHWCEKIKEKYKELEDVDILVTHLSTINFENLINDQIPYYSKHLGLRGVYDMVETVAPNVAVISEWGEELVGYRSVIASAIERAYKKNEDCWDEKFRCLPGDRGLVFDLSEVEHSRSNEEQLCICNYRSRHLGNAICGKLVNVSKVTVDSYESQGEQRLRYLCDAHKRI